MAINIYLSGATVFIDDSINNENIEINNFTYQVNEVTNIVSIQDNKPAGISRTYNTSLISDGGGILIGDSTAVRVYLSEFQNVVSVSNGGGGGGGDASSANQLIQITEAQESNTKLTTLNTSNDAILNNSKRSRDKIGALRVSSKLPLFNIKLTRDKRADFWDEEVVGTATSVYNSGDASVSMNVSASNDLVIRQTNQRIPYKTGDPQLIEMSGHFAAPTANVIQRIGSFNSQGGTPFNSSLDGCFFEVDGTTIYACIYKSGVEVLKIPQSSWNVDKLDGTGESGVTLDISKVQIFCFSYLWLGVDGVTFAMKFGNDIVAVHVAEFINIETGVYMSTPNHSLRYEIRSSGGTASMKAICTAVFTENGKASTGKSIPIFRGLGDGKTCPDSQLTPLIAVRLQDGQLDESYLIENIQLLSTTRADAQFVVCMNPTLVQGITVTWDSRTWANKPNSSLEYFLPENGTNYSLSDLGVEIFSGYVSDNFDSASAFSSSALKIGAKINELSDDYKDVIVLAVEPRNTETFFGGMNFNEL